jgi:hypothetical protein
LCEREICWEGERKRDIKRQRQTYIEKESVCLCGRERSARRGKYVLRVLGARQVPSWTRRGNASSRPSGERERVKERRYRDIYRERKRGGTETHRETHRFRDIEREKEKEIERDRATHREAHRD